MRVRRLVPLLAVGLLASVLGALAAPAMAASPPVSVKLSVASDTYVPGDTVKLRAVAKYRWRATVRKADVRVRLVDPTGRTRDSARMRYRGSAFTYETKLRADATPGEWRAVVTVTDAMRRSGVDTVTFRVTSRDGDGGRDGRDRDDDDDDDRDGRDHDDADDDDDAPDPGTGDPGTGDPGTGGPGTGDPGDGGTAPPPSSDSPHASLSWADYPSNCLSCHPEQFSDAYQGVHYQWQGAAPENVNRPDVLQGKLTNAINSYCVSIQGNWQVCGKCHAGRGEKPVWTSSPTPEQLMNVDCLVCHNDAYAAQRNRLADGSMGPTATDPAVLDGFVRDISQPTRYTCLKCHAYAGGGDAVKRGDLSAATASTADRGYDVHMATTGADLKCQACHAWSDHKVAGRGSDLRVTDNPVEVACSTSSCHPERATGGHGDSNIDRHVARIACQTCHIPAAGRDAADSAATEATEIDRDWQDTTNVGGAKPWHPGTTKANDVMPVYRWWGGTSYAMLLGDEDLVAETDGTYATSKPVGAPDGPAGTKLYPFKYKTATQPMRVANRSLIGIDTFEYMMISGNPALAAQRGLENMGFLGSDAVQWVRTSTYQALNHSVAPEERALRCTDCHGSTARMDLQGELGYALKGPQSTVCTQCHEPEDDEMSFEKIHDKHVKDKKFDCSWCHSFSRPERGLRTSR